MRVLEEIVTLERALLGKDSVSESKTLASYLKKYISNRHPVCAEFTIMLVSLLLLSGALAQA